jgi:hypothetical protein
MFLRNCRGRRARATDHQTSDKKCGMSTELSTQLAILRQRLEESQAINHWRPEPGDTLLGTLRGLKPAQGPFGQGEKTGPDGNPEGISCRSFAQDEASHRAPSERPWDISVQGQIEHDAQGAVTVAETPLPEQEKKDRQDAPQELPPAKLPLERIPDLIQRAKNLKAQGASWREIARRFNTESIPTPSGKRQWHDKTVTRMIGNK